MAGLDMNPVYNYYSSVFLPQSGNKYDNHKKSELKNVYSKIIRHNQKSPLYKITLSNTTQEYALGIKDMSTQLKQISTYLSDEESNAFHKLTTSSSNKDAFSSHLITTDYQSLPAELSLEIDSLATHQVNQGEFLPENRLSFDTGNHTFTINTDGRNYNFSMNITNKDNNLSVQKKLVDFINQSGIGITARLQHKGMSHALYLESKETGTADDSNLMFHFSDSDASEKSLVSTLMLNNVVQYPQNASFIINGNYQESTSNNIAVNNLIQINLHNVTDGAEKIHFIPDSDDIEKNIRSFTESFNQILDFVDSFSDDQRGAKVLAHHIKKLSLSHKEELENAGISVDDDGRMEINAETVQKSISSGETEQLFNQISEFKKDLEKKTDYISLNPMDFVDKVTVSYPNPSRNFPNPYMPSIYSGMLYNYYA